MALAIRQQSATVPPPSLFDQRCCQTCKQYYPQTSVFFRTHPAKSHNIFSRQCRPCIRIANAAYKRTPHARAKARAQSRTAKAKETKRRWRESRKGKDYALDLHLRTKFKLPVGRYSEMVNAQANLCAICRQPEPKWTRLVVDHDHLTKKVRGLLCSKCNPGLGMFRDNPDLLMRAANYLRAHAS